MIVKFITAGAVWEISRTGTESSCNKVHGALCCFFFFRLYSNITNSHSQVLKEGRMTHGLTSFLQDHSNSRTEQEAEETW